MKKSLVALSVATGLSIASFSTLTHAADDVAMESEQDKLSYALGMMIGDRILAPYGEINFELLAQGIKDQGTDAETLMTMEEAQASLNARQKQLADEKAAEAQAAGQQYLDDNAKRDGVQVTESGLQYEVITDAEGEKPAISDTVTVHYVGTLTDGTEFDSSVARGEPAQFPLKGVIPGWTEGLQLMPVGSKYRFVIPADLGYGNRGAGDKIGPGATLVFEVELIEIAE